MIKLLQLIVVVTFFSCSNEKNKNNNLEDILYNSAIDNRSTNYNNKNTSDININKKIVGYRHLNELIKSKTVIKELDLVEYYNENKSQFLRDGDEIYCFRFIYICWCRSNCFRNGRRIRRKIRCRYIRIFLCNRPTAIEEIE